MSKGKNYLVHCKNCNENTPIMDFDISIHNSGECTLTPKERLDEKIYFITHFGLFFGSTFAFLYLFSLWIK